MDSSLTNTVSMQQTAMAACVLGIVLNDLTLHDDSSNLVRRNHPVRPRHLANCMGKKKDALSSGTTYIFKDFL